MFLDLHEEISTTSVIDDACVDNIPINTTDEINVEIEEQYEESESNNINYSEELSEREEEIRNALVNKKRKKRKKNNTNTDTYQETSSLPKKNFLLEQAPCLPSNAKSRYNTRQTCLNYTTFSP